MRQGWEAEDTRRDEQELRGLKIAGQKSQNERTAFGLETDRAQRTEWDKGADNRELTRTVQGQKLMADHDAMLAKQAIQQMKSVPPGQESSFISDTMSKLKTVPGRVKVGSPVPVFQFQTETGEQGQVDVNQFMRLLDGLAYGDTYKKIRETEIARANTPAQFVDAQGNVKTMLPGEAGEGWSRYDDRKSGMGLQKTQAGIESKEAYRDYYRDKRLNLGRDGKAGIGPSRGVTPPPLKREALKTINSLVDQFAPSGVDSNGAPVLDMQGQPVGDPTLNELLKTTIPNMVQSLSLAEQSGNWNGIIGQVATLYERERQAVVADAQQKGLDVTPEEAGVIAATRVRASVEQGVTNPYAYAPLPQSGLPDTEEYTPGFMQDRRSGLNTEGSLSAGIDWNAPAAQRKGSGRGLQKNPVVPNPGTVQQRSSGGEGGNSARGHIDEEQKWLAEAQRRGVPVWKVAEAPFWLKAKHRAGDALPDAAPGWTFKSQSF
jgi:hypothetical protein